MPLSKNQTSAVADIPQDVDGLLRLAAQSMFDVLARSTEGMMVIDRHHRVVWISDGYKRFLPALGFADEQEFVGRPVEDVVPNTQMLQVLETGKPVLVDLLTNRAGTFLVSRLPLRNDAGEVIGALGLVLLDHPETTMQPLIQKFGRLQQELEDTRRQLAAEVSAKRRPKYTIASFIGASPAALEVKRQARRVAQTDSTVLLLGETGTGKELMAHAIHSASRRAHRPLVGVNIAAVPETLLEAEFFGVSPGAYTGADRKGRDGKFKLADGGTLFLDEIGDMPLALQAKLLRVLQEQEVEPLGSNTVMRVDVRVIAATSRDLAAMVAAGQFRADLYYRLNVLPIRVPALRERLDDIEALAEALGEDIARRSGMPQKLLSPDAIEWLMQQAWPGNIRELRNTLEQVSLMSDDMQLTAQHFQGGHGLVAAPAPVEAPAAQAAAVTTAQAVAPLPELIEALEREAIARALQATGGNRMAAARLLQISRASLYERLARWPGLEVQVSNSA
ncbi:sigma-54 interaction domain-containing protein [Pelomonas aquatica]|jgi:transcriptional regulator with PAS, ATPase and Fis domain|uniref:AAA family ATPase n=1 Tax=Pelomonas aquatica TaxID=431058 RepID=A0A9X4LLH7_9BURK|nr:sigma 54-interacting transcriptional regulator [Pelomonas aquatica]MCY4755918.1 sigma 54-interacting transcriptional regulator [Pelomonas aquatica]MDG0863110.1 AAA family ATPase [Pelomonas aquatica]